MRYVLFLSFVISFSSIACMPCDKETSVIIINQAQPKFSASYGSSELFGQVTFKADININNELDNIQLISLTPADADENVMLDMIKRSSFKRFTDKEMHTPCSLKAYELTLHFNVPHKVDLELSIVL